MIKIFRQNRTAVLLAAVFLAFSAGWFLGGRQTAQPVLVETDRVLQQPEPLVLEAPEETTPTERLNINTASWEELTTLPGIGEKRAREIVAYRAEHGPFRIPEQLTEVEGIGEGTLAELIDLITAE